MGDPRAVETLLTRLCDEHCSNAAQPLLKIGGSQALEGLTRVLTTPDYPGYLRCEVARAFKTQARPAPDVLFDQVQHAETLKERCAVAEILGAFSDPRAFPLLLAFLKNLQEDLFLQRSAISALYECDRDRAIEPLLALLTS